MTGKPDYPFDFATGGTVLIGATGNCDIMLPAADGIADQHFQITYDFNENLGKQVYLLELISDSHSVHVDGENTRKQIIDSGAILTIGNCQYRFEAHGLYKIEKAGIVRVSNLSFTRKKYSWPFWKPTSTDILRSISFVTQPGDLFGIFGPSGCGKSTLMDCLRGDLQSTPRESIVVSPPGATIGFVPQDDLVFERLTVEENLRTSAVIRMPSLGAAAIDAHVDRVLGIIGLSSDKDRKKRCSELSGGMRKRVNVAVELLDMPQILLLDEPTSGLDPATQYDFMGFLKELSSRCVTVICVTHALETLDRFDHILLLAKLTDEHDTSVLFLGTPDELHAKYEKEQIVRLFDPSGHIARPESVNIGHLHEDNSSDDITAASETADARPFWPAIRMTFLRAWFNLWRNPLNAIMVLALPVILGVLIFIAHAPVNERDWDNSMPAILLTLIISSLWMGMNLGTREIVAERLICRRDLRSGMGKLEYLSGKVLYVGLFTALQTLLISFTLYFLCLIKPWDLGITTLLAPFVRSGFWFGYGAFMALWISSFAGALTGLTVSSLTKSQALAVTLIPLFLIPHLLFNRNMDKNNTSLVHNEDLYRPVRYVAWPDDAREKVHVAGSLMLISRPSQLLLLSSNPWVKTKEETDRNRETVSSWRGLEWLYLAALLGGHLLALLLVFGYCDSTFWIKTFRYVGKK